jgi:hypothetical protein
MMKKICFVLSMVFILQFLCFSLDINDEHDLKQKFIAELKYEEVLYKNEVKKQLKDKKINNFIKINQNNSKSDTNLSFYELNQRILTNKKQSIVKSKNKYLNRLPYSNFSNENFKTINLSTSISQNFYSDSYFDNYLIKKEIKRNKKKKKDIENEIELDKKHILELRKSLEEKIGKFQVIINSLETNSLTFVTNGSRFLLTQSEEKYFFDLNNNPSSEGYTEDMAKMLNSKKGFFLKWNGENKHKTRIDTASEFYKEIITKIKEESNIQGIQENKIPINLVGHSHGGNIMIIIANKLMEEGYNVQFLFTLNTPVREYQLKYNIKHVQFFSFDDKIQAAGYFDFDLYGISQKNNLGYHTFLNALNIDINYFIDDNIMNFYNNYYLASYPGSDTFYYHQLSRYSGFVKKVIDGEYFLKNI